MYQFPEYRQLDQMDCGPTCLKIITKFFGKEFHLDYLRELSFLQKGGVSMAGLSEALINLGIDSLAIKATLNEVVQEIPLPAIGHWEGNHFLVIYKANRSHIYVSDPAIGKVRYTHNDFLKKWGLADDGGGVVMLIEPTEKFFHWELNDENSKTGFNFFIEYLRPHKKYLNQIILGLLLASVVQLILPFLTQSLVDYGINYGNLNFIHVIAIAQLFLFIILAATEVIRDWILLYISSRINIEMISDYLNKLLSLPITYFDSKTTGDFIQRIYDHHRIDEFISGRALTLPFDLLNILIFGLVLYIFDFSVALIFSIGTLIFIGWSFLFMKRKEILDHYLFDLNRKEQSLFLQIILAVTEIKLNGSQQRRTSQWELNQKDLFDLKSRMLRVDQAQAKGGRFISEATNIIIILWSAKAVIFGEMSLGTMLAVQFIVGSLSLPIYNLIEFTIGYQRAKLSLDRLSEIHSNKSENVEDNSLIEAGDITVNNLNFYYGEASLPLLKNISVSIPKGKVTAIVGPSGSGKTTLLKLLLKLYDPKSGKIIIGQEYLEDLNPDSWRKMIGVVMQEGMLFNDTIEKNITESRSTLPPKKKLLRKAVEMVNLTPFVEQLPQGFQTKIGEQGQLLSGGEKQRLLLARAIYKDPAYFFFDEATSSLDSENERTITDNLLQLCKGKTLVIIAHRLSTVVNADQILVMNKGEIVEQGNHNKLVQKKGLYYTLVKNQLYT